MNSGEVVSVRVGTAIEPNPIAVVASTGILLPETLRHLADEIAASRSMLDLQDDWDGEASPGYRDATWARAVDFLVGNAIRLQRQHEVTVPAPEILPGPTGSIDLHWRTPRYKLLVNVPADPAAGIRYYGDDRNGGNAVEGTISPAGEDDRLLAWLAR